MMRCTLLLAVLVASACTTGEGPGSLDDAGLIPIPDTGPPVDAGPDAGPACPAGQLMCSGVCTLVEIDRANCGDCGIACEDGVTCTAGVCDCPAPTVACGGACVETATDAMNCGGCGMAC